MSLLHTTPLPLAAIDGWEIFGLGLVGTIVVLLIAAAVFIFWIWTIIDAIRNPGLSTAGKVVWVIVILVLEVIGSIIYVIFRPRWRTA